MENKLLNERKSNIVNFQHFEPVISASLMMQNSKYVDLFANNKGNYRVIKYKVLDFLQSEQADFE